ncbi:hypothetical protein EH240_00420 [Mesorhizobium tamadayense]|uniref:Uncharacterized protein n=1 Tax=Mesorhizobium tamadayense TaxID=425306 RepID=A0A3P3GBC3_9HYPH|nr:hypothetical protein [Mesorhizobium tamadayense]RRI07742.1 hypothetical protein EH240_00420 [Mesorhizobium tamadayense]
MIAVTTKVTRVRIQFFVRRHQAGKHEQKQGTPKMDLIVFGIGILFFALSLAYVKACNSI